MAPRSSDLKLCYKTEFVNRNKLREYMILSSVFSFATRLIEIATREPWIINYINTINLSINLDFVRI